MLSDIKISCQVLCVFPRGGMGQGDNEPLHTFLRGSNQNDKTFLSVYKGLKDFLHVSEQTALFLLIPDFLCREGTASPAAPT